MAQVDHGEQADAEDLRVGDAVRVSVCLKLGARRRGGHSLRDEWDDGGLVVDEKNSHDHERYDGARELRLDRHPYRQLML